MPAGRQRPEAMQTDVPVAAARPSPRTGSHAHAASCGAVAAAGTATGAATGTPAPTGWAADRWVLAIGVIVASAGLRLVIGARLPLVMDESYYWEWSRRLAPGYFDHPPAIAFLIRGGTYLIGDTPLGVRLLPQVAGLLAILASVLLAARLGGAAAARRSAIVSAALPVASLGLVLATPDAPLLAMTALTLLAVERAVAREPDARGALGWWTASGILLGFAFLSKYTAVLIPLGVLVALLTHAGLRRHLVHPGPYLAGAIAMAVFLPVVVWNARHGWVSFSFQLHHGLGAAGGSPARRELRYVAALALLASPILFVLLAGGVWRGLRARTRAAEYLLATVSATWAAFFALSALRHGVEANWAAPALLAAVPLVGLAGVGRRSARRWHWLHAGVTLGLALTAIACVGLATPSVLPLAAHRALARNVESEDLARRVEDARSTGAGDGGASWIAADRYQEASELAFTLPGHPRVFSLSLGSRSNQYAFWPALADCARVGDDVVLVLEDRPEAVAVVDSLRPYFERVERDDHAGAGRASGPSSLERPPQLWILHHWRGAWPRRDSS